MLLVAMLPITFSFAQDVTKEDSLKSYNELKEWAVVKLTIAYMEDYKEQKTKNRKDLNKKEESTLDSLKITYNEYSSDVILDDVSSVLKNGNWSGAEKDVFAKYKKELVGENPKLLCFDKINYSPKTKGQFLEYALEEINYMYNDKLDSNVEERLLKIKEKHKKEDMLQSNRRETGVSNTRRNSGNNSTLYISFALLLTSIGVNIFLFGKKKILEKRKSQLKRNLEKLEREKTDWFNQTQRNNSNSFNTVSKEKYDDLNRKFNNLQKELDSLRNNTIARNQETNEVGPVKDEINKEVTIAPINTSLKIVFLTSPFEDSMFANEDAIDTQNNNTLYKVNFDTNANKGTLSLVEGADFSKALNSPDEYLETACIYDNEYNHNVTSIKVIDKGEVKLEGEDWIITKKVRIKFI